MLISRVVKLARTLNNKKTPLFIYIFYFFIYLHARNMSMQCKDIIIQDKNLYNTRYEFHIFSDQSHHFVILARE